MKKFFHKRLHGISIVIPVGIIAAVLLGLILAYMISNLSILRRASVETPAASPTVVTENPLTPAAAPPTPAIRKFSFGKAQLTVTSSNSDFSNPSEGKVFVTLSNSGTMAAEYIDIAVEYLNSNQTIIDTEELASWQNSGVIIRPGESRTFEVDNIKEQILKMVSGYHIDLTWHSRQ
jgi:hypothetical protein